MQYDEKKGKTLITPGWSEIQYIVIDALYVQRTYIYTFALAKKYVYIVEERKKKGKR